jgi:hypothetical protein
MKHRSWMPQPQDALRRSRRLCEILAESEHDTCNFKQWTPAKWARVSNPPNCADQGLRLKRRRDQVAKRPNPGTTTVRAGVDGRHLPNGSAEWRQPRFRNFPRGAWRPEEHGPFLGPNPSIQNHRGSEARRSYSAPQLEYYLTYKPLAVRKAPQSSWVRAGSPRAGPLGTGPCTRRPLNPRNMHSGSPPFFAELVRGTPLPWVRFLLLSTSRRSPL